MKLHKLGLLLWMPTPVEQAEIRPTVLMSPAYKTKQLPITLHQPAELSFLPGTRAGMDITGCWTQMTPCNLKI